MKKEELEKCTGGSRLACLHKIIVSAVETTIVAIGNVLLLTSMLHMINVPSITQQCHVHCYKMDRNGCFLSMENISQIN